MKSWFIVQESQNSWRASRTTTSPDAIECVEKCAYDAMAVLYADSLRDNYDENREWVTDTAYNAVVKERDAMARELDAAKALLARKNTTGMRKLERLERKCKLLNEGYRLSLDLSEQAARLHYEATLKMIERLERGE